MYVTMHKGMRLFNYDFVKAFLQQCQRGDLRQLLYPFSDNYCDERGNIWLRRGFYNNEVLWLAEIVDEPTSYERYDDEQERPFLVIGRPYQQFFLTFLTYLFSANGTYLFYTGDLGAIPGIEQYRLAIEFRTNGLSAVGISSSCEQSEIRIVEQVKHLNRLSYGIYPGFFWDSTIYIEPQLGFEYRMALPLGSSPDGTSYHMNYTVQFPQALPQIRNWRLLD